MYENKIFNFLQNVRKANSKIIEATPMKRKTDGPLRCHHCEHQALSNMFAEDTNGCNHLGRKCGNI